MEGEANGTDLWIVFKIGFEDVLHGFGFVDKDRNATATQAGAGHAPSTAVFHLPFENHLQHRVHP